MRNSKMVVGIILLIAILLVAVGYAAISSISLNITGNATAKTSQDNFKVRFTGKPQVSDAQKVKAAIVDDLNATINVQGLSAKGDEVSARYTVINESTDLSAKLTAEVATNSNPENFNVSYEIEKPDTLKAGESTVVVVKVRLLKTIIEKDVATTVKVVVTAEPIQPTTTEIPDVPGENWVSISEIFDETGNDENKLHIGDFVDYDAGTWTQDEINAIQTVPGDSSSIANGSTELPEGNFQFGGFAEGTSRNENAIPKSSTYNYVKDKSTGNAITGWRVFDIEDDGKVILISAGNPEDYYHPYGYGYISEYILTGNINSSWTTAEEEKTNYQVRNWNNYINSNQKAESATSLTKGRLDSWYSKYIVPGADTYYNQATFQKIYQEPYIKYQNMVENYSYYWLSASYNSYNVYNVNPNNRNVNNDDNIAYGVRVLVSLTSNVKFTADKTGTKTVTGGHTTTYGGDQTYNCWGIQ